jgi:hypothetical protein
MAWNDDFEEPLTAGPVCIFNLIASAGGGRNRRSVSTAKALLLVGAAASMLAQQPVAIQGVLTDSSGGPIPAATISISGPNVQKSVQTGADGSYSFAGLAAAGYQVRVAYPGFEDFNKPVTVEAGRTLELPIQLALQVSNQAVTVTGDRGPELSIDPDQSVATTVVSGSDLDSLPDNPDDLSDLLTSLVSSSGSQVQLLVDGFTGAQLPPKDTIKEIRLNQNRFSAANQWAWAQVEIITKPGADKIHGSLGLTDSDAAFNSRNPFAENKASYVNRMYSANVGDSIKNRASWTFSFYQNTINNTALIDAVTLDPATLAETPVRSSVVVPRNDLSFFGRLDYQISTKHMFTVTYRNLISNRENNGIGQYSLAPLGYSSEVTANELRLRETATLGSNVVTDTRFGYTRNGTYQYGNSSVPALVVAGSFNGGSTETGRTTDINSLVEIQNDTTVSRGKHTIRFGGRLRYNPITDISPANFGGTYLFFGVTNAPVLGANNQPVGDQTTQISSLEQYRRTLLFESMGYSPAMIRSLGGGASQFSIAAGNPLVKFSQTELGVYIDDDWRAAPNLTVSMGLRYQKQFNIGDSRDIGPRLAIAWSPGTKNGIAPKTVFRVGSGYFYDDVNSGFTLRSLRFNGATEQQYVVLNPDFYPTIPAPASLQGGQALTTYRLDPQIRPAMYLQTSATIERQLPKKSSIAIGYNDQRITHLPQTVNINAPLPGTYARGNPVYPYGHAAGNLFEFESGGMQKAQWAYVQINSKPNQKVSLTLNYSVINAHADWDWNNSGSTPSNPYDFRADWGRPTWESPQYFSLNGTLIAPGGVEFSPFLIARSGQPYNLTIGSDINGTTVANERPAFATDLSRPGVVMTKFGAFDTDPMPGQTIIPLDYLAGAPSWILNLRVARTFGFAKPRETPPAGATGTALHRYNLTFSVDTRNLFNHLNPGGYVGALSSPLFSQPTAMNNGYRDTSNNRKIEFGTQFTF